MPKFTVICCYLFQVWGIIELRTQNAHKIQVHVNVGQGDIRVNIPNNVDEPRVRQESLISCMTF